jgi:hypothetical protein
MKTLLILVSLFCSSIASGQLLDTIYVRNLTLQAQDWAALISTENVHSDSTTEVHFQKIKTAIELTPALTWTSNVTVDSLRGYIVVALYRSLKRAPAGAIVARYTAINNAISAKTVLSSFLTAVDIEYSELFINARNRGKIMFGIY